MASSTIRNMFTQAVDAAVAGDTRFVAETTLTDGRWLQVTWDAINLDYSTREDPAAILAHLDVPRYVEVSAWEPGTFVTFSHGADDLDRLAAFVQEFVERTSGTN